MGSPLSCSCETCRGCSTSCAGSSTGSRACCDRRWRVRRGSVARHRPPESVAAGLGCGLDPARLLEGQRQVLLAEDVDTGDDRAIPLRTIASVLAVYES